MKKLWTLAGVLVVMVAFAGGTTLISMAQQKAQKDSRGRIEYVYIRTKDGYTVKDKSGYLVYRVVFKDGYRMVYDQYGKLKSKVKTDKR